MKTKTPGIFRAMAMLLALIMVLSIPISAFAATVGTEDYGISTAAYTYDSVRAKMIAHSAYQTLKYLHNFTNRRYEIISQRKLRGFVVRIAYHPV